MSVEGYHKYTRRISVHQRDTTSTYGAYSDKGGEKSCVQLGMFSTPEFPYNFNAFFDEFQQIIKPTFDDVYEINKLF